MTLVYVRGFALRDTDTDTGTAAGGDDGPIPFVLATEGPKADGLDLKMDRLDLARYVANPVLGFGHDYWGREALPIGRVDEPHVDGGRLVGGLVFDRGDSFATDVERKIRGRFLNAVSVGFDVHNVDDQGVPDTWEMFETSVVPLPLDPDALAADGRILALVRMLGGRAGKVLSAKNSGLVQDAIAALQALLDAASGDQDEDDGRMAERRRRLRLAAHL